MWRLKAFISNVGVWLWCLLGGKKTYIIFRHEECGSEKIKLVNPFSYGTKFQCLECNTLVSSKNVSIDTLSEIEAKRIRKHFSKYPEEYTEKGVLVYLALIASLTKHRPPSSKPYS